MSDLDGQIRGIRECLQSIYDSDCTPEDKFIDIANTLHEIATTFEMLRDRLRDLAK